MYTKMPVEVRVTRGMKRLFMMLLRERTIGHAACRTYAGEAGT
jgi:hypothetical protein